MKKWFPIIALSLPLALFPLVSANAKDKVRIGGDVVVDQGTEVKDAVAVGGSVTVNGKVRDSAVAVGGSVILGPHAVIGKDVVSIGGAVEQAQGSKIHGDVVELNIPGVSSIMPFFFEDTSSSWFWTFKIVSLLGFLALAVLLVAVLPKPFNLITNNVQQNLGKIILWGILGLVVLIPLAIFLAISVIGIPLIALEVFLVGIAFLVGYIAVAQLIGDKIGALMKRPALSVIWLTVMGLLALWLIGWVPFLGSLVKAAVIVLGFGGVLATLFTSRNRIRMEDAL
jgi:MFS family permease